MILTETWVEGLTPPKIDGYRLLAHIPATREKKKGRPMGGIIAWLRTECQVPVTTTSVPKSISNNAITATIGSGEHQAETHITSYYWPPNKLKAATGSFFKNLAEHQNNLDRGSKKQRTISAGDANADRHTNGEPRYKKGRSNYEAIALRQMEAESKQTWIRPTNTETGATRFAVTAQDMDNDEHFHPEDATSSVDHCSVSKEVIDAGLIKSYELDDQLHLRSDHAALLLELKIGPTHHEQFRPCKKELRVRLEKDDEQVPTYARETEPFLKEWNEEVKEKTRQSNSSMTRRQWQNYLETKTKALLKGLKSRYKKHQKTRQREQKRKKKAGPLDKKTKEAFRRAVKLTTKRADLRTTRTAWMEAIGLENLRWEYDMNSEETAWTKTNEELEQSVGQGDRKGAWAKTKETKDNILPRYFVGDDGKQIYEKDQVLQHIKREAQEMLVPGEQQYLSQDPDYEIFQQRVDDQVRKFQSEADQNCDWEPSIEDARDMIRYLQKAHAKRTAIGPDELQAGHILFAGPSMIETLQLLLTIIARAARVPEDWEKMKLVLAHKLGKDPQAIKGGYRPLCVGSLLAKAAESVIKKWAEEQTNWANMHPAIMAYRKNIGHDMAVLTVTEAILHAREQKAEEKEDERIYGIAIDIENAFNGTWRGLVELLEWKILGLRGTRWSISRSISGDIEYRVQAHGTQTAPFRTKGGYGQGPKLSPSKYNTSMIPLLQDLERAGAGIKIGDETMLGVAWSDDLLILVKEENIEGVLRELERVSGLYRKKTNSEKVFIIPFCRKRPNEAWPTFTLGGEPIKQTEGAKWLGYFLSQSVNGTLSYLPLLKSKAAKAAAKIASYHVHSGTKTTPRRTWMYYEAIMLATVASYATIPTLSRETEKGEDYRGYWEIIIECGGVARRMLGAGATTSPLGCLAEAGWPLPDEKIIQAKMGLVHRMRRWELQLAKEGRTDYISRITNERMESARRGTRSGLFAETRRLWNEAGKLHRWDADLTGQTHLQRKREIKKIAQQIAARRMERAIEVLGREQPDTAYDQLWDNEQWRSHQGTRKEVGLMTTARLGRLLLAGYNREAKTTQDEHCILCRNKERETTEHVLLTCTRYTEQRKTMWATLNKTWSEELKSRYRRANEQAKKLMLLGALRGTSRRVRKATDMAVKKFLLQVDTLRTDDFHLASMTEPMQTNSTETTMRMAAMWDEAELEERRRKAQTGADE